MGYPGLNNTDLDNMASDQELNRSGETQTKAGSDHPVE